MSSDNLRVAFIAGTLGLGGAEKQLFLMARALQEIGAVPMVFSLTQGESYEQKLRERNIQVEYVGGSTNRICRLLAIYSAISRFKPHIVQSAHFYTSLYTVVSAFFCRAIGIGAIRSDTIFEQNENGFLGSQSLYLPQTLIVNSWIARQNAIQLGVRKEKIFLLENVIDLVEFDRLTEKTLPPLSTNNECLVMIVAGLVPVKRLERFIKALAVVREKSPAFNFKGVIVGDGPELDNLKKNATENGFDESSLYFMGRCDNIPALLRQAHILVLTSEHEGFPNVLLEAMAAGLPVVSTPAGDAPRIVQNGCTGFIVDHDDSAALAEKIILLASSAKLRKTMGEAGRQRVEQVYTFPSLVDQLLKVYSQICKLQHNRFVASIVDELYRASKNTGTVK
jgi:glycosyltransferase involved in cell wall biosynthesis